MRVFESPAELASAVGEDIGTSDWHIVDQEHIDLFATATDDHQWIHIDPERAAAGPFGGTIAHGFLTLALVPLLVREVYQVHGASMAINYGVNRVRFPAPLRSGSRVRAAMRVESVEEVPGGVQVVCRIEVHAEGAPKPCCVAETVTRFLS